MNRATDTFETDLHLGQDLLGCTLGSVARQGLVTEDELGTLWVRASDDAVPVGFDELRLAVTPVSRRVIKASAVSYFDTADQTAQRARENAWSLSLLHGPSAPHNAGGCIRYIKEIEGGQRLQLACYGTARIVALRLCMTPRHPEYETLMALHAIERRRLLSGDVPPSHPSGAGPLLN